MSEYSGTYRAVVHDNADPLGENRLRVAVPDVFGDGDPVWAAASLPPGDDPKIPAVGDDVWVSFEYGNAEYPIWHAEPDETPDARGKGSDFGGSYSATVVSNVDPEGSGRLHVRVPDITDDPMWAKPSPSMSADGDLPEIGAGVWVEFENGDVNYPVWTGVQ